MKTNILHTLRLFCVSVLAVLLMVSPNCPAQGLIDEAAEKEKAEAKTQLLRNAEKLFNEIESKRDEKKGAEKPAPVAPKRDEKPKGNVFPTPDRSVLRPLEQAKQLIDRNRVGDAVPVIGSILEGDVDFFYDLPSDSDRTTNRTFKQAAEELFRLLPAEGREQYELQYAPIAKRLLGNAVEAGSAEQIEKVANSYFFTESGKEATFLLAVYKFDQGARASALLLLRKILDETDTIDAFEPTFSLTLAACEKSLGQDMAAKSTLEKFLSRNPNPRIWIGGDEFWNPKDVQEMIAKLQSWESEPDVANWLESSGWLLSTGEPGSNPELLAGPPLLEKLWKQRIVTKPKQTSILGLLEGMMRQDRSILIPATRPIYVGGLLIYRGLNEVIAVDPTTGKRVWVGKEPDYRMPVSGTNFFQIQNININQNFSPQLPSMLMKMRLWFNQTLGNLSSDGNLVFAIEEEPDVTKSQFRNMRPGVIRGGIPMIEDPQERKSTTLTARDTKTGKVIWRIGKAPLVQKMLDQIEDQIKEDHKKQQQDGRIRIGQERPAVGPARALPIPGGGRVRLAPAGADFPAQIQVINPDVIIITPNAEALPIILEEKLPVKEPEVEEAETPLPLAGMSNDAIRKMFAQAGVVQMDELPGHTHEASEPTETAPEKKEEKPDQKIVITNEEQLLGETYFLGAPLPVLDSLYVLGENAGLIRLFVLETKTGRLIRHIPLVEPSVAIETDWLRRFRGPSPSYSEGILVCPTAAGAVVAFDSTSGRLLWSYNYSDKPTAAELEQIRMMGRGNVGFGMVTQYYGTGMPVAMSGSNEDFQYIADYIGWTHPSAIIHKGKLVFAPADKTELYCIDLLSGELLWKRSKGKAKYVAGIHKEKVLIVAQDSMIALDLSTGSAVWEDSDLMPLPPKAPPYSGGGYRPQLPTRTPTLLGATKKADDKETESEKSGKPLILFPRNTSVSGIGIRYQDKYMLPLSDNTVAVVDLNAGRIAKIWKSLEDSELGNLVSIGGKVFSQTASSVESFNQIDLLRTWANEEIQANADDPEALYQLGRLAAAEGEWDKALEFFRKGFAAQPNAKIRSALRSILTELFDADFAKYRISLDEIEKLKDSPDSLGAILHAYAGGCVRVKDYSEFAVAFRKILNLDRDYHLLRKIDSTTQIRLARWIGLQVRTFSQQPELTDVIASFAREEFEQIEKMMNADSDEKPPTETIVYRWKQYLEYFGSLPQSEQAGEKLFRIYLNADRFSDMEFLLGLPKSSLLPALEITQSVPDKQETDSPKQKAAAPATNEGSVTVFFKPQIRASLIYELAKKFEQHGNYQSALHYYKILDTQFASIEFLPFASNETDAKTTGTAVFERLEDHPDISALMQTKVWPKGEVAFNMKEDITSNAKRIETTHVVGIGQGFSVSSEAINIPIPCDTIYSPFLEDQLFTRLITGQENSPTIVAWNENGEENWSLDLPGDETDDGMVYPAMYGVSDSFYSGKGGYIKCFNHIMYYVQGKKIYAIDTLKRNSQGKATLLWHKTMQSNIPVPASILNGSNTSPNIPYPSTFAVDPLYVNSHIICLHDYNLIYGIDPTSGEMLWVRDSLATTLYITGDDRYIYLIRPKFGVAQMANMMYAPSGNANFTNEIIVLESDSGEEIIRGNAPSGIMHVLGSKIACIENRINISTARVTVYDLKDFVSLKTRDEKGTTKEAEPKKTGFSTLSVASPASTTPITPKHSSPTLYNYNSFNLYKQGRVLGTLSSGGVTLIDLETLEQIGATFRFPGLTSGAPPRPGADRFDNFHVEFDGDDIIVVFIMTRMDINRSRGGISGQNATINRSLLQNVATINVPHGQVMRYDIKGNRLWEKHIVVENWFLCNNNERYPVLLFGASFHQSYPGENALIYPVVWGMDKKTGEKRFSKKITGSSSAPNSPDRMINFTKVYVDPKQDQIIFNSQRHWSVVATFTNKSATETYDTNAKKITPNKLLQGMQHALMRQLIPIETLQNIDDFDFWFWF